MKMEKNAAILIISLLLIPILLSQQEAYAQQSNTILRVLKFTGTTDADSATDITISPNLSSLDKAFAFCSFRHNTAEQHRTTFKAWDFTSTSNLRIFATSTATPLAIPYVCYVVEFTSDSALDAHRTSFTITATSGTPTYTNNIGQTVTLEETMEWYQGHVHDGSDTTIGTEELDRIRLVSTTQWEWQARTHPNTQPQTNYLGLLDWNDPNVVVQRGQTSIAASATTQTLVSGTDFTAVDRTRSILLVSFRSSSTSFTYAPNVTYISSTIDPSGNLVFQRNTADSNTIEINWTLVEFPANMVSVQHLLTTIASGSGSATEPITTVNTDKSMVVGTVCTPFGCGTGRGSSTTGGQIGAIQATLDLSANQVTITRDSTNGSFTIGYQVAEFLLVKTVSETVNIGDSTIKHPTKVLEENLTISDVVPIIAQFIKNITDSLIFADTNTRAFSKKLEEQINLSESIDSTGAFSRTISESLTIDDAINTEGTFVKTITEAINFTDSVNGGQSAFITLNESFTLGDIANNDFAISEGEVVGKSGSSHRERTRHIIDDVSPPMIFQHYIKPEVVSEGDDITVTAQILDDVGVFEARILYFIHDGTNLNPELKQVQMQKINMEWWQGTIPGSDVRKEGLSYWIAAIDFGGNVESSVIVELTVQQAKVKPEPKVIPFTVTTKKVDLKPNNFIEVITVDGKKVVDTYSNTIVIKNNRNSTLESVRLMLSPEISNSFYLDRYAIKSIEPNGNATVTIKLHGNPNKDPYGKVTAYDGNILVMSPHHSPVILPLKISSSQDSHYQAYMDKISALANKRYNKVTLLNDLVSRITYENKDFELLTSSGREITNASDELIIRNTGDKQLRNVRIIVSELGSVFIPDKSSIRTLAPNESITVQLIPKIDNTKYSPKDFVGEIIVVADNGLPKVVPIRIAGEKQKDSIEEFAVFTLYNNTITRSVDRITIKNVANRTMDSVKIMLPKDLDRILHLSVDRFSTIAPNEEITVDLKFKASIGEKKESFMQNYNGELTILSEHHNLRKIPIKIEWKKVESEYFTVYSRSGDESIAKQVIDVLEKNYQNVTSRFGEMKTRTVVYMASNLDEMKIVNPSGNSYYSYTDDAIFICACRDAEHNAMKEFIHRLVMNNHANYSNMKKLIFDRENWLVDGISSYIASNMTDTGMKEMYMNSFTNSTTVFQWYGYGSDAQYGATFTFLEYLEGRYGSEVIDRTIHYLGTGMISNHKCDTVENCAILRAVYDANGWDMDKKRYTLSVKMLTDEWQEYVMEHYNVDVSKQIHN